MGFVLFSVEVSNHLFLSLCPTLEPTIGLFSAETLMAVIKCLMNYKQKNKVIIYLLTMDRLWRTFVQMTSKQSVRCI